MSWYLARRARQKEARDAERGWKACKKPRVLLVDRKGWKTKLRGEVCANSRWTAVIPRSAPLVTPVMIPSWPLMCPSLAACGVPCLLQLQLEYLPVFLHRLCVGSRQHLWAAPLRPVPVLVLITMLSVGKAAGGREGGHRIQPTGSLRTPTPQPTWAHAPILSPCFSLQALQ